ncbi:potassium channel family protein [Anaerovorax odorimutans]|uniref:potassium channel family protein n=1 Tax=Anaerovorax odorimutans TaxID=109327 RepID=UPI0004019194|nr:potassium channel protein [Anaerovorax odorimutans]
MKHKRQIILTAIIFLTIIIVGTIGYYNLLNVSLTDALYMTVITVSTVGYTEVGVMTPESKIFSIFIIFAGVGTAGYAFTRIVVIFIEGSLRDLWRNKKMESKIAKLENHYILCGAGESGRVVADLFFKRDVPFVIIEKDESIVSNYLQKNMLIIGGDATEESILEKANIKKAKGLISALSKDVDNLYTVLTARQLNSNLYIISRSIDKSSPSKLKKAGANYTISANAIGGRRMASLMLRPSVVSFLDIISHSGDIEFNLEDIFLNENSEMVNKKIGELNIPARFGLIILAIKKDNKKIITFNPGPEVVLEKGDIFLVLGKDSQVSALKEYAHDNGEHITCCF